ncbi:MAG TPA: hypothetical protein VF596_21870 [Pyrinomonadaceae bacterium]|jgi:hypothetical protein
MNDAQRRKFEKYAREIVFMDESEADFPANSPGKITVELFKSTVNQIESLDSTQLSGTSSAEMSGENKDDAIDRLLVLLRNINRAANAMEDDIPNIDEVFRMPRNRADLGILNAARQFKTDAAPHSDTFIEYGLPSTFIADLDALITHAENQLAARDAAIEQKGGATGGLIETFKTAAKHSRKLDSIVRNKYAQNAQKLAAWTIASHLERAPQTPTPPPPQP